MTLRIALFDLDNTIYPASSGLMQMVDVRINGFVREQLGLAEEEAAALRRNYFLTYGTTLRGLQTHHEVDTEHYLRYVHDIAVESYLASDAELDHLLEELPLSKYIFTNSPHEYAERVLHILGIERHFSEVFDIRSCSFYAKPDRRAYDFVLETLGVSGAECIMIEDTAANLAPASEHGMTTILISAGEDPHSGEQQGAAPPADYVVPDVLAAVRTAMRLAPGEGETQPRAERPERGAA